MPAAARRSSAGVRTTGWPYAPVRNGTSWSAITSRMFGARLMRSRDALRRSRQPRPLSVQAHVQLAAGEGDDDRALTVRRRRYGHGARPRRARLPHPALPHARGHAPRRVDARDLDVRPLRKARVPLEQRPDAWKVVRIADDDGVRVPDVHRDEVDPLDALRPQDLDRELLLDPSVGGPARDDFALADAHARALGAEPGCNDPRRVPGHLGGGAVGVPDDDVGPVVAVRDDLGDAVRIADAAPDTLRIERLLRHEVHVSVRAPPLHRHS